MNKDEQIKALQQFGISESEAEKCLISRDAIIPVIEKVREQTFGRSIHNHYRSFLIELWKICNPDHKFGWNSEHWIDCILANPQQLAEALLRATGRWQETK